MKENRLQNKVATSSFTLPVAALIATLLWAMPLPVAPSEMWAWICCALCTYLMVEFNNSNALIRIRSRLSSSFFLYGMACFSFLHHQVEAIGCAFLMLTAYYFLFRSYQDSRHTANIYHAFVAVGIAVLLEPIWLFIIPFAYWSMSAYLRSFSFKIFCASIVGLITPAWFYGMYLVYYEDFAPAANFIRQITSLSGPTLQDFRPISLAQWSALGVVFILALISSMHTIRTSYNDKIRTRMLFYTLIVFELGILLLIALFPQSFNHLLAALMITTAPIIAHFFALTHLRITNILFILALVIFPLIAIIDYILPIFY